jgi:cardiolipin synthase
MKRHIPNILTYARLVLCLVMFLALTCISPILMGRMPDILPPVALAWIAVVSFIVAAVTDFFDGWLARRWNVTSMTGAILDPIADKILVAGAIIGLLSMPQPQIFVIGSGLILFREFSVSALREVLAPRGIKLPVTFLAKTKTTLQLVALAAIMILNFWTAWGIEASTETITVAMAAAELLYFFAALVTVWTGIEYALSARRAMGRATLPRPNEVTLEPLVVVAPKRKPATRQRSAKSE